MDLLLPTAEDAIEFEAEQSLLSQSETLQRLHQTFGDAIPTRGPPAGNAPATASATASRKSNAGRPPKKPSNVGSIKWDALSIKQKRDLYRSDSKTRARSPIQRVDTRQGGGGKPTFHFDGACEELCRDESFHNRVGGLR